MLLAAHTPTFVADTGRHYVGDKNVRRSTSCHSKHEQAGACYGAIGLRPPSSFGLEHSMKLFIQYWPKQEVGMKVSSTIVISGGFEREERALPCRLWHSENCSDANYI